MKRISLIAVLAVISIGITACNKDGGDKSISISGSNTMAEVATAWAEKLHEDTGIRPSVAGGGSSIGIKALEDGHIDICTSSRSMKDSEKATIKKKRGKEVKEFVVGYDALAIFVHPENPLQEISVEQIKQIYLEGGSITTWEQI